MWWHIATWDTGMGLEEIRMEIKASLLQLMASVFKCRTKKFRSDLGS